jgi:hypothetical protein
MLEQDLQQFTGGEVIYKHFTGMHYTEGMQYLAEQAGAYWLIDAIASYQTSKVIRSNPRLLDFQLWELTVTENSAVLMCREDSGMKPVIEQKIEYTDFPLPSLKVYVEGWIVLLPSEH